MICPAGKCECVHADINGTNHICNALSDVFYGLCSQMEVCPWPSKIEAPKKNPWIELAENIFDNHNVVTIIDGPGRESQILDIADTLSKCWPKGDIDKAWFQLCKIIPMNQDRFKEALKAGGFI